MLCLGYYFINNFSATWFDFTIAREITVPLQILSDATESVAHGNYKVKIDDIVSDDEMGKPCLSFRNNGI